MKNTDNIRVGWAGVMGRFFTRNNRGTPRFFLLFLISEDQRLEFKTRISNF